MANFSERLYLTDGLTVETRTDDFLKVGNANLTESDVMVLVKTLQYWLDFKKLKYTENP